MDRRRYLTLATLGTGLLAGCNESSDSTLTTEAEEPKDTATTTATTSGTPTETPRSNPSTIFISEKSGTAGGAGTRNDPLAAIQNAIDKAQPGEIVHVLSGEYRLDTEIATVRSGVPEAPITITGPKDAIIRAPRAGPAIRIKHSHIHLRGLSIDGLVAPDEPKKVSSYSRGTLVHCRPPADSDKYLENIVFAPDKIGNSQRPLTLFERTKHLEIGPFRVSGVAGAQYLYGDRAGHAGEIVYLGQPPIAYEKDSYPWDEIDQTRHVHVHHIDNSAGHPHSEIVNAKVGTRDVLVEYCTDGGGSQNTETRASASIRLESYDATARWCTLRNGQGYAIHVQAANKRWLADRSDPIVDPERIGTGHQLYGNDVAGFGNKELVFDFTTPSDQDAICGNTISTMYHRPPVEAEPIEGDPSKQCSTSLPSGNGVGHTGGDSPWA